MLTDKYAQRGVSSQKEEVHEAIQGLSKGLYPKAFCKILPDNAGGSDAYCNIMHADTAGTKASLAYIYWKETGDLRVWAGIAQDALVMNLDDMACVGVTDNIQISSTIGRNKSLISGSVLKSVISGTMDFIARMAEFDITIHHAGGETADVGDIVRTIDVGITAFARIAKDALIVNDIKAGNVIVGLASYGKASYEQEYNSGIGSNGLTSARHDVFHKRYASLYPESFNPAIEHDLVYAGGRSLQDAILISETENTTAGKLVLSPTRTYLPILKRLIAEHRESISGMIHCTGGAQTKVLHFVDDVHIVKNNMLPVPPVFTMIQEESKTPWKEMYKVFNMGHRLEIYTDAPTAASILTIAKEFMIDAQVIGYVEKYKGKKVTVETESGKFEY